MAKISALTDGDPAVGTDIVPVARSSTNRRLTLANVKTLVNTSPTITGTVTASQVTGIQHVLAQWGVPVGLAPSGTMADNGAVTFGTALSATYSGGLWLYYPAGAVAAGVPASAGFLWTVMSSTTVGTVYNSTFTGASVPAAGTATAFSTTGPGAFTGISSGEITAATVTVPAGAIGPNGALRTIGDIAFNTAAGNKIFRMTLGGTIVVASTVSTSPPGIWSGTTRNLGVAGQQASTGSQQGAATSPVWSSINTASATTYVFTIEKATATNWAILQGVTMVLAYGA